MESAIEAQLKKVTEKISGLPTLPEMLQKINRMMLNPRTSAKEVAQVISSDPSLTTKVLRVVNSSFYGFPNRISTITHAIVILGFNTVKSIVLSTTIFDMFKKKGTAQGFDRGEFWKHSLGVGACARTVAKAVGYSGLEEIFIAGLLHDIGKTLMDQHLPELFAQVWEHRTSNQCLLVESEQEVLGVTHAEVGAWLFQKWNLSKGIVETTRYHHNPALAGEHQKLAAIIHLSDILARAMRFGNGGDERIPAISETAWASLGLQEAQFERLMTESAEEIEKAMIFLEFTA